LLAQGWSQYFLPASALGLKGETQVFKQVLFQARNWAMVQGFRQKYLSTSFFVVKGLGQEDKQLPLK